MSCCFCCCSLYVLKIRFVHAFVLFTSRNEHAFLPSPYLRKVQYNTFFVIAVLSKRFRDFGIFIFYYTSIRPCSHYPMQLLITHLPMYKKDSIFFFCKKIPFETFLILKKMHLQVLALPFQLNQLRVKFQNLCGPGHDYHTFVTI